MMERVLGIQLDIRSVLAAVALVSMLSAAARLMLWRQHRAMPGLGHWACAGVMAAVSLGLLSFRRGFFSNMAFSAAPILIMIGYVILWDGFRRFTGRPPLSRRTYAVLAALAGLPVVLFGLDDTALFRAAFNSLTVTVISALIAVELFVSATRVHVAMRTAAWVYAVNSAFFLIRCTDMVLHPQSAQPLTPDHIQMANALWWLCMPLATTLCMVLMVGERIQLDLNSKIRRLDEVTAQRLADERLRLAEKERMEATLRQWMVDSSHELRTPLSVLRAQIEAIQDGVFAADAKRLESLHDEVMGMARLVEELFLLARSDIGRLECRADPVDILPVLDGVVHAFRGRYVAAGLDIEWLDGARDGEARDRPVIAGDEVRLRQVFANLLENSLRYTDPGGRLRLQWGCERGTLTVKFDDSAPGVPDATLTRLFDRFFRVDASRSRSRGGSGIGLAVCRTLVEAHGGAITASHSPLGGLRILLQLPGLEAP